MEFFGKKPTGAVKYMIAKVSFFTIVFLILIEFFNVFELFGFGYDLRIYEIFYMQLGGGVMIISGIILILAGIVNLGSSLRMGLPSKKTEFRTSGLYRFSRNPIYLGFILIDVGAILYLVNPLVLILAILSIVFHHMIIIGEEEYMKKTHGKDYLAYKSRVRRYL